MYDVTSLDVEAAGFFDGAREFVEELFERLVLWHVDAVEAEMKVDITKTNPTSQQVQLSKH